MPTVEEIWGFDPGTNGTTKTNGGIPNTTSDSDADRLANTTISPVTALHHTLLRTRILMDGQTAQNKTIAAIGSAVSALAAAQKVDAGVLSTLQSALAALALAAIRAASTGCAIGAGRAGLSAQTLRPLRTGGASGSGGARLARYPLRPVTAPRAPGERPVSAR